MNGREPPKWTPQSTTPLDEPPPWQQRRMARGSAPPPFVSDADDTAPRVRLVALFEHDPVVPVSLERARPPAVAPRTRVHGAPWILPALVVTVMALLGWLMLTR